MDGCDGQFVSSTIRYNPRLRRDAMFRAHSGRLRFDPSETAKAGWREKAVSLPAPRLPLRIVDKPKYFIFVVVEATQPDLSKHHLELHGAAHSLLSEEGGAVCAITAGGVVSGLADAGADRQITLGIVPEDHDPNERLISGLSILVKEYGPRHILFADNVDGRYLAGKLATDLGMSVVLSIDGLEEAMCLRKGFAGQCTLQQPVPQVLSIAAGNFLPLSEFRAEARVIDVAEDDRIVGSRIKHLAKEKMPPQKIPLDDAAFILSAGDGVRNWACFESVAEKLNATPAGTRVVCDKGYLERDRQVGASGKIVSADMYVALGISGAIQHLQGIESCKRVVAVNLDPQAPIMQRADFALVHDVNKLLSLLDSKLDGIGKV